MILELEGMILDLEGIFGSKLFEEINIKKKEEIKEKIIIFYYKYFLIFYFNENGKNFFLLKFSIFAFVFYLSYLF